LLLGEKSSLEVFLLLSFRIILAAAKAIFHGSSTSGYLTARLREIES
jgi:hypothetical protein